MIFFLLNGYEKLAENINGNLSKASSGEIEINFMFSED